MIYPISRGLRNTLIVVLALIALIGYTIWNKLFRETPQVFATMEEQFKYGSIGAEEQDGIPYWIWLVLPRAFPDHMPEDKGGYGAFGMIWETGHETPFGSSNRTIGFPRIAINCALCHSASYRTAADQAPIIVPTGPTQRFDALAYVRFLSACASDPRFTPDYLLPFIEYNVKLSWLDRLLYRYFIIPATREGLLDQRVRYAWTYSRPLWGPGRIDPFNPVKFHPRQLALDPNQDDTIGNSDMQPIWNMARHAGYALHWDGLNSSLTEVVLSGAIGDGATQESLPVAELTEMEAYLKAKQPPAYPFKEALNQALVNQGEPLYKQYCADCHAFDGERTGKVLPLAEVGTDRHRLDMWTAEAAQRYNHYASGYDWDFNQFVKTDGYVNVPLDGLWLRAPYLHNGSVPTLEDLLKPAAERTKVFYRGYDVYLPNGTGFVHSGTDAQQAGFLYDTRLPGNGNGGHEGKDYGTDLSDAEKGALIEYLKTL